MAVEAPTSPVNEIDVDQFLSEARERYQTAREVDAYDRLQAEDDNNFAYADDTTLGQWDEAAKKLRKRTKRPIIQWNRLPTSIQQVANDGRENKPSIRIAPEDGGIPETAEFFQARIRHIEYDSNASTAKDTARDQQITTGRGSIRVKTEYIPGTWKQRICIDRIENQFSVVWDPAACAYDRTDAEYCFVISLIGREEHLRKYGEESTVNRLDFADAMRLAPDWIGVGEKGELIQIAEYFVKEYDKDRKLLMQALASAKPKEVMRSALTDEQYKTFKQNGQIIGEQQASFKVHQYIINGAEILDHTVWIGSTIPIVPFWGKEAVVGGQKRTYSLIRNAKAPQRTLNLLVSNLVEKLGQQSKSPLFVPVGGIPANAENDYRKMAVEQVAYLLYNAYDDQEKPLPRPEKADYEPPIQGLVIGIREAIDGIKAAMGIYDAALGAKSNETSGIAIQRRQKESDVSNYHFPDNEARSNKYLGEILIELIPLVDQKGSEVPIRSEDGKTHVVPIGVLHKDWKTGKEVTHDLQSGQYGVSVDTGPSYTSQRQEQFDRDAAIITAQPEMLFVIGDQMYDADDTAGAKDRAERLRRYIAMKNPGLIEDKQQQPIPPEVQAEIAKLQQELQATDAHARSLFEQIQTKQHELDNAVKLKQMDIDFQREKLGTESDVKLAIAGIQTDLAALEAELKVLMHQQSIGAEAVGKVADQQHQSSEADAARAHDAEMSATGHEQTLEQQDAASQAALKQQEQAAALAPKEQPNG